MKTTLTIVAVILIFFTVMGLVWIDRSPKDLPISVALSVSPQNAGKSQAKIALGASVNGNKLGHAEVCVNIAPIGPSEWNSPPNALSIRGFTDAHGAFIAHWAPDCVREYMIVASVKKVGYEEGRTVRFLRRDFVRQTKWLAERSPTTANMQKED